MAAVRPLVIATDGTIRQQSITESPALIYQTIEATGDITTTSTTDVLATGMTTTPAAGTYLVIFSGSVENSNNDAGSTLSIYRGGTVVTASVRTSVTKSNNSDIFSTNAVVTVNGSQAIEGKWRVGSNTGTMHTRSLMILQFA